MMGYYATGDKEEVDVPSVVVLRWIAIAVDFGVEWLLRPPWLSVCGSDAEAV
jgi:hypothetical protein